ncbi:MAG: caspase family protein [Sphaerochaetaceae bacterium]|nr:caspase family protein [Sphaerochaetaceae bacterium]
MKRIALFISLLLLSLVFISCELLLEKPARPRIHALFIALDYHDSPGNRLYGTIRDAKELDEALGALARRFDQEYLPVRMFQEGSDPGASSAEYPTKAHILAKIAEIGTQVRENDVLFVYYAGHGMETSGNLAVAHPTDTTDYEIFPRTDFLEALDTVVQGNVIVVLDSCYSGLYVGEYPSEGLFDPGTTTSYNPRRLTVSAARGDETSQEIAILLDYPYVGYDSSKPFNDPRNHIHGAFTSAFLEALGWDHGDGTGEQIDANDVITEVDGQLLPDADIPSLKQGSITVSDVYRLVRADISRHTPMTVQGPLDMVLFSDRW